METIPKLFKIGKRSTGIKNEELRIKKTGNNGGAGE